VPGGARDGGSLADAAAPTAVAVFAARHTQWRSQVELTADGGFTRVGADGGRWRLQRLALGAGGPGLQLVLEWSKWGAELLLARGAEEGRIWHMDGVNTLGEPVVLDLEYSGCWTKKRRKKKRKASPETPLPDWLITAATEAGPAPPLALASAAPLVLRAAPIPVQQTAAVQAPEELPRGGAEAGGGTPRESSPAPTDPAADRAEPAPSHGTGDDPAVGWCDGCSRVLTERQIGLEEGERLYCSGCATALPAKAGDAARDPL
jgi:hypothetical protein